MGNRAPHQHHQGRLDLRTLSASMDSPPAWGRTDGVSELQVAVLEPAAAVHEAQGERQVMSLMLGKLYTALRDADIDETKAREAAEEVAGYESRLAAIDLKLAVVQALLGVVVALSLGMLWLALQMHQTLAAIAAQIRA